MSGRTALLLAALVVCSLFVAPLGVGAQQDDGGDSDGGTATGPDYSQYSDELAQLASVTAEGSQASVAPEREAAAIEGARQGAEFAQQQGVNVTQAQLAAAEEAAVRAAAQSQNASVRQLQAAVRGSAYGTLLQSQSVNVSQVQAGVYGGAAGALSQSQTASATQLQSAAYGAAHGAVAQAQRVNVSQIQYAAVGAAAGAANAAAQSQDVSVSQVQEAAQGGSYGSLTQIQEVTVRQVQAAAFGGAGGGAANAGDADAKQVQEAAIGAAQGSLSMAREMLRQEQRVSVEQIQAAARGACEGALRQVQRATITQIQQAASGAARGALSQSQYASVTQIQSAAAGAANGVLEQVQDVQIVQIQSAAEGAAAGAARGAVQRQIVNVEQIQAAARGAGQGAVIQLQTVDVRQVQSIASGAATGALTQMQSVSITQIQSAAQGASEGTTILSQRQRITIRQSQRIAQRAAQTTVVQSIQIDIQQSTTIINYARGAAQDDDGDDDDPERLRSLFVDTRDDGIFLANPNDEAVTVTITSAEDDVETVTLSAGESETVQLDPGTYTLTAETSDGRAVELSGRESLTLQIGEGLGSLDVTQNGDRLRVENPNDVRVTLTALQNGTVVDTFRVPASWEVVRTFDPGSYDLTAETDDGRRVQVAGENVYEFTVEPQVVEVDVDKDDADVTFDNPSDTTVTVTVANDTGAEQTIELDPGEETTETFAPGEYAATGTADDDREVRFVGDAGDVREYDFTVAGQPDPVDLGVTQDGANVTVTNPSEDDVTVTATDEDGDEETFDVSADDEVTEQFDPGNYTLTGETDADREVLLEGNESYTFTVEAAEEPPIDLGVSQDGANVTVTNPSEDNVTLTATDDEGDEDEVAVPAGENVTEQFDPGNYTLTGETDTDREVLLNGESAYNFSVEAVEQPPIDLDVTQDGANVTVENPSEDDVTATVTDEAGDEQSLDIPAGENVTEAFGPGNYTLAGETDADREVLVEGNETFEFQVVAAEPIDLNVSQDGPNVTIENPSEDDVTLTATDEAGDEEAFGVPAGDEITEEFDPGNYTLTGETDADREVLLNGDAEYRFTVSEPAPEPIDLNVTQDAANLTVANPSDDDVTVTAVDDAGDEETFDVPADDEITEEFDPGNYTLTGETDADREVLLEGNESYNFTVEAVALPAIDLNVSQDGANVTVTNPSEDDVTVTATDDADDEDNFDVPAGENVTEAFDPGNYTLAGETDADREVLLDGNETYEFEVAAPEPIDLDVTQDGANVTVENPSEDDVTLTATDDVGEEETFEVPADDEVTEEFAPGNYTLTGETEADREVLVDGNETFEFTVEAVALPPINLTASVADGNLTVENPSDDDVTVTATSDIGEEETFDVPAGEDVTEAFAPGNYTLTGETDAERAVLFDGNETFAFTVSEPAPEPIDLAVTVAGGNVSLDNPSEAEVTVTATDEAGDEQEVPVPAGENVTEAFEPGNYTLTGESFTDQPVTLNGGERLNVTIEATAEPVEPVNLTVTVGQETVAVENPSEVDVSVNATNATGVNTTIDVPAGENVSSSLAAGEYTLRGTAPDDRPVLLNDESALNITVEAVPLESLSVVVGGQNVSVENPNDVAATVTATNESDENTTVEVPAGANVTERFGPGNYTLSAEADDRPVPLNGESTLDITVERAEPEVTNLNLTVGDRRFYVANPTADTATVRVSNATGTLATFDIPVDGNVSVTGLDPGTYEVSATDPGGETLTVDGESPASVTLPPALESLTLSVTDTDVELENPNEVPVTANISNESGIVATVPVPAEETVLEPRSGLDPGTYVANATNESGLSVPVNDRWNLTLTLEAVETATPTATETATATAAQTTTAGTETGTTTATADGELATTDGGNDGFLSSLWPFSLGLAGLVLGGLPAFGRRRW